MSTRRSLSQPLGTNKSKKKTSTPRSRSISSSRSSSRSRSSSINSTYSNLNKFNFYYDIYNKIFDNDSYYLPKYVKYGIHKDIRKQLLVILCIFIITLESLEKVKVNLSNATNNKSFKKTNSSDKLNISIDMLNTRGIINIINLYDFLPKDINYYTKTSNKTQLYTYEKKLIYRPSIFNFSINEISMRKQFYDKIKIDTIITEYFNNNNNNNTNKSNLTKKDSKLLLQKIGELKLTGNIKQGITTMLKNKYYIDILLNYELIECIMALYLVLLGPININFGKESIYKNKNIYHDFINDMDTIIKYITTNNYKKLNSMLINKALSFIYRTIDTEIKSNYNSNNSNSNNSNSNNSNKKKLELLDNVTYDDLKTDTMSNASYNNRKLQHKLVSYFTYLDKCLELIK